MKTNWNVTKLIAAGSLGVLHVILTLAGAGITVITGIPLMSGLINVLFGSGMPVLVCLVIDQFGAATIEGFVVGILAIPLPVLGTPGFLPKVGIKIASGLIADVLYRILRRNKLIASIAIGAAMQAIYIPTVVAVGRLVGMPGIEETARIFLSPLMFVGAAIGGALAGCLGWLIYSRIKDTAVVVRIQGE